MAEQPNTRRYQLPAFMAMMVIFFFAAGSLPAAQRSIIGTRQSHNASSGLEQYSNNINQVDEQNVGSGTQERERKLAVAREILKRIGVGSGLAALASFVGSTYSKSDEARASLGRLSLGLGITSGIVNLVGLFVWLEQSADD